MSSVSRTLLAAGLALGGMASAVADSPAQLDPAGEKLYRSACVVCHASGVANAPKLGDKQAWAPFLAQGADALLATVLKGKGGGTAADEATLRAAVAYMMAAAR